MTPQIVVAFFNDFCLIYLVIRYFFNIFFSETFNPNQTWSLGNKIQVVFLVNKHKLTAMTKNRIWLNALFVLELENYKDSENMTETNNAQNGNIYLFSVELQLSDNSL